MADFTFDIEPLNGEATFDANGIRGLRGYSAYEVAVQEGYVGTEEEWLASLKGEKGDKGDKGDTGATGPKGDKGDKGEQGIQGVQGIQGEKGDKGDTGEQGIQGIKGDTGAKGDKGDKGDTGHSPVVTASKSQGVTTISVDSEPIAAINDGHSPEITTSKSGTTTTILSDGEPIGTVDDGDDYILTSQDKTDIAAQVRDVYVDTVSGSAVSITGVDNHRYMCGTVSSISITPPSSGIIDVVFTSGSTAAVLMLPETVKMPEGFSVEADTIYEINILDGLLGVYQKWTL